MTCREFVEFLAQYLAGDLSPTELAVFDAHLSECPSCVAYLKTYRRTIELGKEALKSSEEPVLEDIPEELVEAILSARRRAEAAANGD